LAYILSKENIDDILTKSLNKTRFKMLRKLIRIKELREIVIVVLIKRRVGKNLLKSVLLVLERAAYKSGLPLSLPLYKNLGSDALFICDICLYIPIDSTLLYLVVALKYNLSSLAL
jgi:hypothetical protein